MKKFTEQQTRALYNHDDLVYRALWDKDGNCHWGYFADPSLSPLEAMVALNEKMLKLSDIGSNSSVLDLGCGNGNNSFFIQEKTEAKVIGLDLSDTRIENANDVLSEKSEAIQSRMWFMQGTAEQLPFKDKKFSHVWSQATIYHVHNKKKALKEIARVLKKGGTFIFDDVIKPNKVVSKQAEKFVYERLLFDTPFTVVSYQQELQKLGFRIMYAEDMSQHFATMYAKLADMAEEKMNRGEDKEFHTEYKKLITAYRKTCKIVENGDVGWAMFVCKKVG